MSSDGLSGLYNLGNTCYMNSFLQVLSHSDIFKNEIKKNKNKFSKSKGIMKEWIELDNLLWSKNCIVQPNKFLKTVQEIALTRQLHNFCGFEQNDVTEFIMFIFDEMHKACKISVVMNIKGNIENECDKLAYKCYESFIKQYENDYSLIIKLFYSIQITYNKRLSDDETISTCCDSNFILNIPLKDNVTQSLENCIDLYLKDNLLIGENGLRDEKTGERCDIIQKTLFWNLPEILIIGLKRFSYDGRRKNCSLIKFPIEQLNMNKYVYNYKKDNYNYELYAVCNHSGRLNGGHYTSYVKLSNGDWYHFNDATISKITNQDSVISPKAYCLFYKKKY